MNNNDFDTSLDGSHALIDSVLRAKGDEYTVDDDRLSQFKAAAKLQRITTKEALGGMMVKHTTSVYDMIGDGKQYSQEQWDEKIIDHINYLILLRAVVEEEIAEARFKIKMDVNSMYPAMVSEATLTAKEQYLKTAESFKSNIAFQGDDSDAV